MDSAPALSAGWWRTFPRRAWLSLGTRGEAWAAAAAAITFVGAAASLTVVLLSFQESDIATGFARHRRDAAKLSHLDRSVAVLMTEIQSGASVGPPTDGGARRLRQAWSGFETALGETCPERAAGSPPDASAAPSVCKVARSMHELLAPRVAAFASPNRPLDPALPAQATALHGSFDDSRLAIENQLDVLADRMASDHVDALFVLTVGTAGLAGAGLVLILLVGRTSIRHFERWRAALDAADAALEARDVLRETLESMPIGIVVYDQQERLTLFNPAAVRTNPLLAEPGAIGTLYEEHARRLAARLEAEGHGPHAPEAWLARFRRRDRARAPEPIDGRWFEFSEHATPSGRTVGLRVDVTDLKTRELELERARGQFEALVDSLSDTVYALDVRGRFTFVSASAIDLLGFPAERLLGERFVDHLVPGQVEEAIAKGRAHYRSSGESVMQVQLGLRRADGAIRQVEIRYRKPAGGVSEEVVQVGVIRDVERRVRLERRLAEESARLRAIFETGGMVMALMDRELRYTMVNQDFVSAVGVPEDRIIGRTPQEVLGSVRLDLAMISRWKSGPIQPGRDDAMRYTRTFHDAEGRLRHFSTTVKPIVDEHGNLQQILALAIDDTDRRNTEQALFDAERTMTVGEMAGTLAHEISQPLQVINIACASAMDELVRGRESGLPIDLEFVESKIVRIGDQIERATRTVSELRAFVRDTTEEPADPFDPELAVRGAIELTGGGVRRAGGAITVSMVSPLPRLLGQVGRLEQVLVKLINNARDAGASAIEVSAGPITREGRDFLCIAVEDTGPGIAPEVLPHLFESLVTTRPRGKGRGLGLRICRRIVEEMGGTISAANRADGGARFEILLPTAALH